MNVKQNSINANTSNTPSSQTSSGIQNNHKISSSQALLKTGSQNMFDLRTLSVGQSFQGEILDIRNNSLTISIDNQLLYAKFQDSMNACIGEVMNFVVKEISDKQVYISPILNQDYSVMDHAIDRALEAANLSPTDRNLDIVSALLKNNMPVDKQSLQNLIATSFKFPQTNLEDLVLMTKFNLDITSDNITQFENYRNYEHQITSNINDIMNLLPETISNIMDTQGKEEVLRFLTSFLTTSQNHGDNPVMDFLNQLMSKSDDALFMKETLKGSEFKDLLNKQMIEQWSISPDKLNESRLNQTFEDLYQHMSVIKDTIDVNLKQSNEILSSANKIQDNLNFMKNLNDNLIYTQLPLQLNNKITQSELYVYTDKHKKLSLEQGISLHLHLDMEHLQSLDISVNLQGNRLQANFLVTNNQSKALLEENLNQLEQNLQQKGYSVKTNVEQKPAEKTLDFVKDILNANEPNREWKRYSFDMRI